MHRCAYTATKWWSDDKQKGLMPMYRNKISTALNLGIYMFVCFFGLFEFHLTETAWRARWERHVGKSHRPDLNPGPPQQGPSPWYTCFYVDVVVCCNKILKTGPKQCHSQQRRAWWSFGVRVFTEVLYYSVVLKYFRCILLYFHCSSLLCYSVKTLLHSCLCVFLKIFLHFGKFAHLPSCWW